jgi:hypothetical protein
MLLSSPRLFSSLAVLVFGLGFGVQQAAAQGFNLDASPLNPSPVSAGANTSSTITVTPIAGFNATVSLSVLSTCPSGASCRFSVPTVTPTAGKVTSILTISPTPTAPAQSTVTITATSGAITHTASVTLTVSAGAAAAAITSASDTLKNSFGFGVALGLAANVTGANIVNNATIDANGFVRVNTRANTSAGFMLESHYLIWPKPPSPAKLRADGEDTRWWGVGPFVAAQPGSSQIISAVGAGWMIGFRRPKGSTPSGFGLGIGYEAIPAAQVLGKEFVDGQKAPIGPNGQPLSIRYETQDKGSLLVILSVTF